MHLALAKHMHVDVVDGLAALLIAVHHQAKALVATLFGRKALGGVGDMANQGLVVNDELYHREKDGKLTAASVATWRNVASETV